MKNFLYIFILSISPGWTNEINDFPIKLLFQGSDSYSLSIEGKSSSSKKDLKLLFTNKVKEVCGTRFELLNVTFDRIIKDENEREIIQGSFKCFVKSQM
jgi:hypothetical protein